MIKVELIRWIPYLIIIVGLISVLFAFYTVTDSENTCNQHYKEQIDVIFREVREVCPFYTFEGEIKPLLDPSSDP